MLDTNKLLFRVTVRRDHKNEQFLLLGFLFLIYSECFLCPANAHMGYFAPPDEYQVGGYESQLTFWGINTAVTVRNGVRAALNGLYVEENSSSSGEKTKVLPMVEP